MKTSDSIAKLSADFVKAQAELKNAAFDKVNPHFKSKYATLSAVRDTVTPVLAKYNMAVIQGTYPLSDGWGVMTRLVHSSGEWIESVYPFTAGEPQKMGSALTYSRRYSLAAICGIASEEDDDGNAAQSKPNVAPTKTATRTEFQRLCADLEAVKTWDELQAFDSKNATAIAGLNPDLQTAFTDSYKAKRMILDIADIPTAEDLAFWKAQSADDLKALNEDAYESVAKVYAARKIALSPAKP